MTMETSNFSASPFDRQPAHTSAKKGGQDIRLHPGPWTSLGDHGLCHVWFMCWPRGYQDTSGGDSVLAPKISDPKMARILVLNEGNGWVAGGCWDYHS